MTLISPLLRLRLLRVWAVWFAMLLASCGWPALADEHNHRYQQGEEVVVWRNTIGPYANRQETYAFEKLAYCRGSRPVQHRHETLGEALQGMELVSSDMDMAFLRETHNATLCDTYELDERQTAKFRFAATHQYWYELFIDGLPVWGFVGNTTGSERAPVLYTHQDFVMLYNEDRIIEAHLNVGAPVPIPAGDHARMHVRFTYSVTWQPTLKEFQARFDRYAEAGFFTHKIHWLSILISFCIALLMAVLAAAMVARALKRDLVRYGNEDGLGDLDRDLGEEYGWKQVHGDVFRPPRHLTFFAASFGTGYHMGFTLLLIALMNMFEHTFEERGSMLTAAILLYAVTAFSAGYVSARYYRRRWMRCVVATACLWPAAVAALEFPINALAVIYSSTRAIPFLTLISLIAIWLLVACPMTMFGAIFARSNPGVWEPPCRVNPVARAIPEKPWYLEPAAATFFSGLLPFCAVFAEMYYVFISFWAYSTYYTYGFALLSFLLLLCMACSVSITHGYFLLNAEDHRCVSCLEARRHSLSTSIQFTSFSPKPGKMSGLFQTSLYFVNTAIGCTVLFLVLGAAGYSATSWFVYRIYYNVKND
ncbi:hypothetical protein THASP1DRAFT_31242 [Thamnocephalis sphaerospora]|uniref:Transmembrane 9 superfamily member n=1 Tax=Thamnocephalis sphaerospora TaxID=78915 RepID=A0A4P9XM78_9FUNG|nr:hypothetical protein THASP1DRAFT_31242 [Thamnocephalis sphaerospora]|eukprot:RKP06952.1 hypothetical protein THASP1DRAFT_31242 [Thamnocephalis sphaerospora]